MHVNYTIDGTCFFPLFSHIISMTKVRLKQIPDIGLSTIDQVKDFLEF